MAGGMLDLGQVANLAMGVSRLTLAEQSQKLQEQRLATQEAHYEETAELQRNAQKLDAEKMRQTAAIKGSDEIDKIMEHPTVATNRGKQVQLLKAKATMLEQGLGVKIPMPDDDELMGGYESMDRLIKTIREGTPEERMVAATNAFASNPKYFSKVFDDMKKAGDLSTYMEELQIRMDLHKTQLQALNQKTAKTSLQQNFYTQHVSALGATSSLQSDPRFAEHLRKMQSFTQEKARDIYLDMHPDFKAAWDKKSQSELATLPAITDALKEEIDAKWDAIRQAQARDGEAPKELVDEVAGYESVYAARQAQAAFLADPYNKQNWKNLRAAEQNVQVLNGRTGKQLSDIADQRTQIMQTKLDNKQQTGLAESLLEESFINHLNDGKDDNQALGAAIKDVRKQYPGVPFDATKIVNPSKKGRSEISIKMPSETVSANLKQIDAGQGVLDLADEMLERIEKNPSIVGKGAAFSKGIAGFGQQFRALVGADPGASRFLNTQTRDEAESFQEMLVYLQAKTMDPSGALDVKVIQHAREVIGDLSGWTTGSEQMKNKLRTLKDSAARSMRRARQHIRDGQAGNFNSYLGDAPAQGGQDAPAQAPRPAQKSIAEMSESEVMKELLESLK